MAMIVGVAALCCVGLFSVMLAAAWVSGRRKRGALGDLEGSILDGKTQTVIIKPAKFVLGKMGLKNIGLRMGSYDSKDLSPVNDMPPFTLRGAKQTSLKILSPLSPQEAKVVKEALNSTKSEGGSPGENEGSRHSSQKDEEILSVEQPSEPVKLGTLDLTVNYDAGKSMLVVCIVKANELPAKDPTLGTSDPYIKLQLLPEKRHRVKTRVLRRTVNPVYDESFTFYGITRDQMKQISLHLVVLSFDRFSRDDVIGEVLCPLLNVDCIDKDSSLHLDIAPRQLKVPTF